MSWVAPAAGAVLGALGSRGGGSQTTTTEPWAAQQPYLQQLFAEAKKLYGSGQLANVQGFDPLEMLGQQEILNVAQNQLPQISNQAMQAYGTLLNAPNVQSNPVLQQYIQAALRPLEQSLMQNVLPGIAGEADATGNVGGTRQGIAQGLGIQEYVRQGADVSTRIMQDAYARGLQAALGALGQGQNLTGLALAPSAAVAGVGAERRTMAQAKADAPLTVAQRYLSLINGSYGGTTTTPGAQGNPLLGALGGALVGNNLQNLWAQPGPSGAWSPSVPGNVVTPDWTGGMSLNLP